ncbi:MAG: ComEC/Rec2 family competence protein [Alphaproteobacteria bacterium]|nr:ComEC/Rec2 family competence protein [Alphaproteobacteria bacterium]
MVLQAIRSIASQWQPQRDRVLWAPVLLGAGVACYFAVPREPAYWESAGALATATALYIAVKLRAPRLGFAGLALFLVTLGFLLAQGRSMMVHAPMLDRPTGVTRIEGRVLDITVTDDDADSGKRRVTLGDLVIEKLPLARTPATIRLSTRHVPSDVVAGERIAVLAKLMPPSGPVAPDGFDYRRQAYFEQLGAVGFTLGKFERVASADASSDVWFSALRQTISRHIATHMKHPESALATALLAGERSSIPDDVNAELRDSGLYHLLSISGLHVAIVCGVTFFVLRFLMALWPWMALHWPIKKIAAVAALGVGVFYILLSGATIPAQRSMLTTGLVLVAVMLDRAALSLRTLAVVALVVLAVRPESLVGASFQLSFAAVTAMIVFHEGIGRRWMAEGREANAAMRVLGYFAGIIITTVLVGLATFPIVLHHFGRAQIYGVLANAAAIPLTSFIVMPAGMAAMVLMPFGLDGPFLKLVEWGITQTLAVSAWVAHLPHAAWAWPSLPMGPYIVSCFGLLLVCLWRGWFRWVGVPLMIGAIAYGFMVPRPFLLVDAEGKNVAVHGAGQTVYLFKKPTDYLASNWLSLWGGEVWQEGKPLKAGPWAHGDVRVACDDWACRIENGDARIAVVRDANALAEECLWAHVVVALDKSAPRKHCAGSARFVSSWDVHAGQGGAIALMPTGPVFVPIFDDKTVRPWSVH